MELPTSYNNQLDFIAEQIDVLILTYRDESARNELRIREVNLRSRH